MNINRFIAIEIVALFAICSGGLVCCRPSTNPPPEPPSVIVGTDADASASVTAACGKITSLCAITTDKCTAGLGAALTDPLHPFIDWACISSAATKAAMQGCGGVGLQGCP